MTLESTDGIKVRGYFDAAFGIYVDCKSQSESVITTGKGEISARSRKQKILIKSSAKFELVFASDGVPEIVGIMRFLEGQGYVEANYILGRQYEYRVFHSKRTIHIRGVEAYQDQVFFIKQHVEDKEIEVVYMLTEDMLADILTKP